MSDSRDFEAQLQTFRTESGLAAQYLYAEMAVQHAASRSSRLLNRLNQTPFFWNVHLGATQVAAYITLGRIFDTKSPYNVDALLNSFERNLDLFARAALEARKLEGTLSRPEWLDGYLTKSYYPTERDVARLRGHVTRHRAFYDRAIKPVRHKVLAHRERYEHAEVQALYRQGKVKEMWKTVTFLLSLHEALWQQFVNGRKPVLHPLRHSVKSIYDREQNRTGIHEMIVRDTRKLMECLSR
jgi:hypothetical protein